MTLTTNNWPQVPGVSSSDDADDSRLNHSGARGAYNPRVRTPNCRTTLANQMDSDKLKILTFNVRTLGTEERLIELEHALSHIKWDIIGLAEVRREGEKILEREDSIFYHMGESSSQYGVGFLIHKKWKNNIIEFISYSDRIALLKFKIDHTKTLTIIQVYAPTSTHTDDEIEEFYDLLNRACDEHRGTWMMVIGDFNAKIGSALPSDNYNILGPHGIGHRNDRGTRLIQFASSQNLNINNTFFYKKPHRRWTWFSPDGHTKNEIDFSLSSTKQIVTNIEVLNNFKFSSDHRPLRITLSFNAKIRRIRMIQNSIKRIDKSTLIANKEYFLLELKNSFQTLHLDTEDVETQYRNISKCIQAASRNIKTARTKTKKLSPSTIKLIEERQKLNIHTPEYKSKDKEVKRKIRTDIRNYNTQGVKQGDPLSPKLFTATLEEVFKKLAACWSTRGVVVGEKRLTNLRFADDIVLFSSSASELGGMINELSRASLEVGLKMNMSKTKLMTNSIKYRLEVDGAEMEYVHEYIYLGQLVSFQARQEREVARRTENAWKSYWSMRDLMKGNLPLALKRKLMDVCILPILTYGAQPGL
ncbi:uncharacterized protein LOC126912619 [Spodoptera frugiperda]|uniref:Uncharacterized protein LOC126912619 n=1 Tax=Spodoptera frugiperda TaxID=7108 RepID=A0A9R0F629_SPOFR|nr:uncharacterized protein LOC126912619 [Spodoptera frugiperda]